MLAGRLAVDARTWETGLAAAVASAGATIRRDDLVAFEMVHADAPTIWDAMGTAAVGALWAAARRRGPEFTGKIREEFLRHAPRGEWRHLRRARVIVADK